MYPEIFIYQPGGDRYGQHVTIAERPDIMCMSSTTDRLRFLTHPEVKGLLSTCTHCRIEGTFWKKNEILKRTNDMPYGLDPSKYCFVLLPGNKSLVAHYRYIKKRGRYIFDDHYRKGPNMDSVVFDDMIKIKIHIQHT